MLREAIPSHGAVTGAIGRGALAPGLIPASRGPRMEGGCRRFFAVSMLTSARPGQASATAPAARPASASGTCPMTGPALALLNARVASSPAAMKACTANKTISTGTVTEGQASP